MLDAALIKECADPSLRPAIVEQFVKAVGSDNPFAITVKSGGRLILVAKPKTPEEAIEIVRESIGGSVVRVGHTQIPAGLGLEDASELKADLVLLSAHGYSGETRWPYGSLATSFILYGNTPLLIVQDLPRQAIEPTAAELATREFGHH